MKLSDRIIARLFRLSFRFNNFLVDHLEVVVAKEIENSTGKKTSMEFCPECGMAIFILHDASWDECHKAERDIRDRDKFFWTYNIFEGIRPDDENMFKEIERNSVQSDLIS